MANGQSVTQATAPKPKDMLSAFQSMAQQGQSNSQPAAPAASTSGDPMLDAFKALKGNPDAAQKAQWVPNPDDSVAEIQTSDGNRHLIHGDDVQEAQRRDANLKVLSQPQTYRDYTQSRTLENMTRAMSGQPMARPEDQAEAERGRKAGTIQGGIDLSAGFLLGPALEFLGFGGGRATQQATKEGVKVATGILDEHGNQIFREVAPEAKQVAGKILRHPIVEKAVKMAVKKIIGEEAGRRAGQAMGGEPGGYAGATLGALVGDRVLNWILAD